MDEQSVEDERLEHHQRQVSRTAERTAAAAMYVALKAIESRARRAKEAIRDETSLHPMLSESYRDAYETGGELAEQAIQHLFDTPPFSIDAIVRQADTAELLADRDRIVDAVAEYVESMRPSCE